MIIMIVEIIIIMIVKWIYNNHSKVHLKKHYKIWGYNYKINDI